MRQGLHPLLEVTFPRYEMIRDIVRIVYEPHIIFEEQLHNARLIPALINIGLTGANIGVAGILFFFLAVNAVRANESFSRAFIEIIRYVFGEGLYILIILPFAAALITIIIFSLFLFIVWVLAHAAGGRGTWVENMYLFSLLFLPIAIGTFAVNLILVIPWIGTVLSTAWTLYMVSLFIRAISVANRIPWHRAAALFLALVVLILLLTYVVGLI